MGTTNYTTMKKLLTTTLFSLLVYCASAQQEAQFSQYMNNNLLINPGVTGIEQYLNLNAGYRNQWNGLNGAINTYYLTGHQRMGSNANTTDHSLPVRGARAASQLEVSNSFAKGASPHGVGGYVFRDDQGVSKQNGIGANYAYHLPVGESNLSFGASVGLVQYTLNTNKLSPLEASDQLLTEKTATATGDLSAGVWFSNPLYYVGVSINQLSQSKIKLNSASALNKQNNHYYISGGYKLVINETFTLLPSVLVKYVNPAPPSIDVNALASIMNKYLVGISYRNEDAIVLLAGVHFDTYQFGYSYDINTSGLSAYNNGTHELTLGLGLGKNAIKGKTLHW